MDRMVIHSVATLLLLVEPVFTYNTMTSNLLLKQLKIPKECLKVPMSQTLLVHGKLKTKTKGEKGDTPSHKVNHLPDIYIPSLIFICHLRAAKYHTSVFPDQCPAEEKD